MLALQYVYSLSWQCPGDAAERGGKPSAGPKVASDDVAKGGRDRDEFLGGFNILRLSPCSWNACKWTLNQVKVCGQPGSFIKSPLVPGNPKIVLPSFRLNSLSTRPIH